MKLAVCTFLLLAVVAVSARTTTHNRPNYGNNMPQFDAEKVFQAFEKHGQKLQNLHNTVVAAHGPRLQTTCLDAFINFIVLLNDTTCQSQLQLAFDFSDHTRTQPEFLADITTYCTGCAVSFTAALTELENSCTSGEITPTDEENIRMFLSAIEVPCARSADDTEYCADDFYAIGLADDGTDYLTPTELATFCAPCVKVMFNQFMQFSTDDSGLGVSLWINLICQKDLKGTTDTADDEFCWPLAQAEFAYVDPDQETLTTDEIEGTCQPCVRQVLVALSNIVTAFPGGDYGTFDPAFIITLDGLCVRDTNNRICLEAFLEDVGSEPIFVGAHCPAFSTTPAPTECSTECLDALYGMIDDMGCCAAQIPLYLTLAAADDGNNPLMTNFYNQVCLDSPNYDTCGTSSVVGTVTILNFLFAWYDANKLSSDALIIADITLTAGADAGSVTLGTVSEDANGAVVVSFVIGTTSNAATDSTASAAGESLSFPTLNQDTPLVGARSSFTASLSASSSTVTAQYATYTPSNGGTGSACGKAVGAAAVLAPAAVVVLGL
jgi:hypothetical protein